jgi:monoamine oxidase|eukprot:COSAG01_NODE_197_length_22333_cov_45.774759_20_plen_214_part_00
MLTEQLCAGAGAQEQYVGRFAIVTLPIGVLGAGQVTFSPPLPQRKLQAIGRLGAAKMNKVVLHFRSQFWGQNRHIGIASTSGQHGWFYNASSVCKAPVLVYYLMGDAAQAAEQMPDASIVAQCLRMLRAAFRPTHVPEPVGTYVTRWCSDPLARGAFSFFEVGSSPADCAALKEPLGWRRLNVGFAGEAATVTNMGTVLVREVPYVSMNCSRS